jgi:Flp pilus assembly pilin Flp
VEFKMKHAFYKFLKAENGVAAIEFALIIPVMCALYFGMIDLTQLITFNRKATTVSDAVGNLIGQNRAEVQLTELTDYYNVTKLIMGVESGVTRVNVAVFAKANPTAPLTQRWTRNNGTGPNCGIMPTVAELTPLVTAEKALIVVQTCFKFSPYTGYFGQTMLGGSEFLVEQTVVQTPRSTPDICIRTNATTRIC